MQKLLIKNSKLKSGEIKVNGYKHATVMILMAAIIGKRKYVIKNVPDIEDVQVLLECIKLLNGTAILEGGTLYLDTTDLAYVDIPETLTTPIHGSIYLIPVLSSLFGKAKIKGTGGCQIGDDTKFNGKRPIGQILETLECFGAECFVNEEGFNVRFATQPQTCTIDIMRFSDYKDQLTGPRVSGATKTAIFAAMCVKEGVTIIKNPYQKGDVRELLLFIQKMGYTVEYVENTVKIFARRQEPSAEVVDYKVMSDPTEIMTYISCAVYHKIPLTLTNVTTERTQYDLRDDIAKLTEMGINLQWGEDTLITPAVEKVNSVDLEITSTGILSDHQPFYCLMLLNGNRQSKIVEHVWHHRFAYASELTKLGAQLRIENNTLVIEPCTLNVSGQTLLGTELRGVAALTIASLAIKGTTIVSGVEHLRRGYQSFLENLQLLGSDINIVV